MDIAPFIDGKIEKYLDMFLRDVDPDGDDGDSQYDAQRACEVHLLHLLQNKELIKVAREYVALSDDDRVDFSYEKIFRCGARLIDFQYLISWLFEEEDLDLNEQLLLQAIPITCSEEENKVNNTAMMNPCPVQKKAEAFCGLTLETCQEVGGSETVSVELRSNLFYVKGIVQEIFKKSNSINCIERENVFYVKEIKNDVGEKQFLFSGIVGEPFPKIGEYNTAVIEGEEEHLEVVYDCLKSYLPFLTTEVDKYNIFEKLKEKISELKDLFHDVQIRHLPVSEELRNGLNACGCYTIREMPALSLKKISLAQVEELFSCIGELEQDTPGDLFRALMKELKPSYEVVVRERFFGENICSLEEVGSHFGLTRERIRQIELRSIEFFNAPERKIVRSCIISQMQLLCKFDDIITPLDLEVIGLSKGELLFLEKCLDDIEYDEDFDVFFYNKTANEILKQAMEELPTYFTVNELEFYIEYLLVETDNKFTHEEIEYLLKLKYKRYGDFFSTGRLKLGVVLPYLLSSFFPDGMDIYNENSIDILREKARERFDGFELSDNNRAITARIRSFCIPIGRGLWKYDSAKPLIGQELLDRIIQYLNSYNAPILPISAVLQAFSDELLELDITNKYHLQGQLKLVLPPEFKVNRDYVYREGGVTFYSVVEEYIKQSKTIVTKHDLQKQFPGITDITIQQVEAATRVVNMNGYFTHLDNLNISEEEIYALKACIADCIVDDSIYHSKDVFTAIKHKMSGLFGRIGVNHYLQFFYLARELLPDEYTYDRPFMAKKGIEIISGEMQVLQRIQEKQEVSIKEVRELAREVGTIIERYIEFANRNNDVILIKDAKTFINADYLELDETSFANLDDILRQFLDDADFKPLALFYDYWKLPKLKTKWTSWLLYSVINLYSKSYKTAVSSNYIAVAVPIVVRNDVEVDQNDFENIKTEFYSGYSGDEDELLDAIDLEDIV